MLDAYKIGITVALTNNVSKALTLIGKDFAKTDAQALKLKLTLKEIKKLTFGGLILGGAGYAGIKMLESGYESAKKYEQVLAQFKALNLGDAINKDADKFARGANIMGASATDLIGTVRDLHTALGDYGMSKAIAPQIAQMKYANQVVFGGHGMDFSERQLQSMEKIIEMKGGFKSPQAFLAQADMMQKVISGTGGMVKPSDYLQFIKTAGVSGRLLSNEMFYYTMEPLIQEMTGGRVGTGTMSAYNNLAQGRSTNRAATEMMKLGILDPKGVLYNKIGNVKQINPGALKGMDEYTSNPYQWMKDVLLPSMAKRGITAEKDILNEMGVIFGNRTGSSLFSLMFLQQEKIAKNMVISKNAMGREALVALAQKTPEGAEKALGLAWENLKIASGEVIVPIVVPALLKLSEMIRQLGKVIDQHPVRFKYLIEGFAGLSAALMIGGSVLILTAALKGLGLLIGLSGGAGSLVGTIGGLAGKLNLLGLAAFGVYELISHHQDIANAIDKAHPEVGDLLMNARDKISNFFSPPPTSKQVQVNTQVHLDGRQIATVVSQHQANAANSPLSSNSGFDGRLHPQWGF